MQTKRRKSRVLEKIRKGEVALSYKVNLDSSRVVELVALLDFDCIWTCMEHCANDYSLIERQIQAAKMYDKDVLVRVSRGCYSDYIRPLELDASGIIVPHIMSAEDARNVVKMTRFNPIGRRPIDGGNADGLYATIPVKDYIQFANENRFIIFQIEDPEPMAELEEIAKIKGYDILFFGPGDYSHAIGVPGELNHPDVLAAQKKVAEVARKHGKFAGTVGSPQTFSALVKMGYQFLNLGADVITIGNHCNEIIARVADLNKKLK
jgi:4-hydroxy-2-oxoheptanedioate aldolase